MVRMRPLMIRLPAALLDRAEALVPLVADSPDVAAVGAVSRATVVRIALAAGLDALERRLGRPTDADAGGQPAARRGE